MAATPQPIPPYSLGGTLYGQDVNTLAQAGYAQQQQALADQALAAQNAAQGAQGQVQQAIGQGIPQDPAFAQLLQTMGPAIADAITGGTGAQQRGEQKRQETRQERLQAREDNLTQLRDNYRQAAAQAKEANDLKNEITFRNKTNLVERQLDEMKDQIRFQHAMALEKEKAKHISQPKTPGAQGAKKLSPAQKSMAIRWGRDPNKIGSFIGQLQSYPELQDDPDVEKILKTIKATNPDGWKQIQGAFGGQ